MATQNLINNTSNPVTSTAVTIDPGSSGDSWVQYDLNSVHKYRMGVDDNASDSFKLSAGYELGVFDLFVMTAAGERTMPLQPLFIAKPSSTLTNVTGGGTIYTVIYGTESIDQGSDYDNTTGLFTAPITGRYKFVVGLSFTGITSSVTNFLCYFGINGTTTTDVYIQLNFATGADVSGSFAFSGENFVELTAGDTLRTIARGLFGSDTVNITTDSFFGGFLCT